MESLLLLAADNPLDHVVDVELFGSGLWAFTLHTGTLILAAVITVWVMMSAARSIATGPESQGVDRYLARGKLAQMIEVTCLYIRDEVVRPLLGENTDKFIPYLWTLFFFILINNLLGLVPLLDVQHLFGALVLGDAHWAIVGGTATGNIAITAGLAIIAFIIIQVNGLRSCGIKGWATHFLGGAPLMLAPIMIPVEIMGTFIKPFALAVRLFANMVAGHTLLATLLMFTKMGLEGLGVFGGAPITIAAVIAAFALTFLELLVAFIQAFVFMFLTAVFIAQLTTHHHDDSHEEHGAEPVPVGAH